MSEDTIHRLDSYENKEDMVIMTYGRFQPLTKGHLKLFETVRKLADIGFKKYYIMTSESYDDTPITPIMFKNIEKKLVDLVSDSDKKKRRITEIVEKKKNPLHHENKLKYIKDGVKIFGLDEKRVLNKRTLPEAIRYALDTSGAKKVLILVGSDRVEGFNNMLKSVDYSYELIGLGRLDTENKQSGREIMTEEVASMIKKISASKVRASVIANDYELFKTLMPDEFSEEQKTTLFNDLRHRYRHLIGEKYFTSGLIGGRKKGRKTNTVWITYSYIIYSNPGKKHLKK